MRVGLNCLFLVPGETGGMEVYARALIPRLAAEGIETVAFLNRESRGETFGAAEVVAVPIAARQRPQWVLGEQLLLPVLGARARVAVLHSLASTGPLTGAFRRVTTVHDLLYRAAPEAHSGLRGRAMSLLVPGAARRSHLVLADSEATRAEVLQHIGLAPDRVTVVPLGVEPAGPATPAAELRARLALGDRRVILTTGGTRPHKNVRRLVAAVQSLAADVVLVVTGYATAEDAELAGEPRVLRTGPLSRADLEGLYALADVVAAPSLAEGFGLPVLEAMIRGVPVACSATGALGELAGEAAVTFDPTSVAAIADALRRLLDDPSLRSTLVAAGRARAADFTWERTAALTAAAYRRAAAG